jgi:hypothetical protein
LSLATQQNGAAANGETFIQLGRPS